MARLPGGNKLLLKAPTPQQLHSLSPQKTMSAAERTSQQGRSEKRIAAVVAVSLSSLDAAFLLKTELAKTENISNRGARVSSRRFWPTNEFFLIKSLEGDLRSEARVIYCQRMHQDAYTIGLELIGSSGKWQGK